jgi:hypothetical protein
MNNKTIKKNPCRRDQMRKVKFREVKEFFKMHTDNYCYSWHLNLFKHTPNVMASFIILHAHWITASIKTVIFNKS